MKFLILLFLCFYSSVIWAQDSRWIDLEWDAVPEAKEYELELLEQSEGEEYSRGKFKVDTAKWSHAVAPGKYSLRLRSIDDRGVPGEWSEKIPLKIKILSPVLIRPSATEKIDNPNVNLEWNLVPQAKSYQVVVRDQKNEVIHNLTTPNLKDSVFLKDLGDYNWSVFALSAGDDDLDAKSWPEKSFRRFERVGGELESLAVKVSVEDKVTVSWTKIEEAQVYELDFIPPSGSGEKNKRFHLKANQFIFPQQRLKEGVTTITLKAQATKYQDSIKSIIKIVKKNNTVTSETFEASKVEGPSKPQSEMFWRNQIFISLAMPRFSYSSKNYEADTKLEDNYLTGFGGNIEWYLQEKPEKNTHKFDFSALKLSSGNVSGVEKRAAYDYLWSFKSEEKIWSFGAGASYLGLPVFNGNRFTNKLTNKSTSSLGPEFTAGIIDTLSKTWQLNANIVYAYHPLLISSPNNDTKAFGWFRGQLRFLKYLNSKDAFFFGAEYQRWDQKEKKNSSSLSGWSGLLGYKRGW